MNKEIFIRKAQAEDQDAIWEIIAPVISKGDTYAFAPDSSREKMLAFWCGSDRHTYVVVQEYRIVGLL